MSHLCVLLYYPLLFFSLDALWCISPTHVYMHFTCIYIYISIYSIYSINPASCKFWFKNILLHELNTWRTLPESTAVVKWEYNCWSFNFSSNLCWINNFAASYEQPPLYCKNHCLSVLRKSTFLILFKQLFYANYVKTVFRTLIFSLFV